MGLRVYGLINWPSSEFASSIICFVFLEYFIKVCCLEARRLRYRGTSLQRVQVRSHISIRVRDRLAVTIIKYMHSASGIKNTPKSENNSCLYSDSRTKLSSLDFSRFYSAEAATAFSTRRI